MSLRFFIFVSREAQNCDHCIKQRPPARNFLITQSAGSEQSVRNFIYLLQIDFAKYGQNVVTVHCTMTGYTEMFSPSFRIALQYVHQIVQGKNLKMLQILTH
jgi:hypothetical protein